MVGHHASLGLAALPFLLLAMMGCAASGGSGGTSGTDGSGAPSGRIYELRIYHAMEGKRDELVARFRDHTDALFGRHHMTSIGYWVPEEAPNAHNLLVYVLEHPSRQDADRNWAAFMADPDWIMVKRESEVNGPLVDHIDRYFMAPTSFSALK